MVKNMKKILETIKKYKKTAVFLLIIVIGFIFVHFLSQGKVYARNEMKYGITFSKKKAQDLGLDWKKAYKDILNELDIKKIRLSAYWDEVEEEKDSYYYKDTDWQIKKASENNAEIILAVGGRLPRWPECHFPDWAQKAPQEEREKETLEYIEKTINKYKDNENIVAWQVENEPFLSSHFGECPSTNVDFLDSEIKLVRKLDPSRPIIVTDSGELSLWVPAAARADIFGTTMYKNTYSSALNSYVNYPITPGFFHFKKNVASWFANPQKWIVIELQGEPWGPVPYQELKKSERDKTMNPQKFTKMVEFARQSGFKELYLWGAEYWYWEKVKNNNDEMWNKAKDLFSD